MDVYEIIRICNMHPRVNILQPGPGVGGHCISVDPWFLVGDYPSLAKVIDESMQTNDGMPDFVLNRIHEIMREKGLARLKASTQIMITPLGFRFRIVSRIVTNFHQPKSTLLLLVSAYIGDDWRRMYKYALDNDFRFLSYGDSSLLICDK